MAEQSDTLSSIMLPPCIHRGDERRPDHFECRSNRIVHATIGGLAPRHACESCPELFRTSVNDSRKPITTQLIAPGRVRHAVAEKDFTCIYRGEQLEAVECASCSGSVKIKVFACGLYGQCTLSPKDIGVKSCLQCKQRTTHGTFTAPKDSGPISTVDLSDAIRNLAFHVYPVRGSRWREVVESLLRRIDLFNGRRCVSVAWDDTTVPFNEVEQILKGYRIELTMCPNNPKLQEVRTFVPMLRELESNDPREVTFYAHAKGVTRANPIVIEWTDTMFETCLDDWPRVEEALRTHAMAGSFRRYGDFKGQHNWRWHYSGTFYWFRNRDVFSRDWRTIDQVPHGVESWPGRMFPAYQTACLFLDDADDLYEAKYWATVRKELAAWRRRRGQSRLTI